jgi:hypothetical protein
MEARDHTLRCPALLRRVTKFPIVGGQDLCLNRPEPLIKPEVLERRRTKRHVGTVGSDLADQKWAPLGPVLQDGIGTCRTLLLLRPLASEFGHSHCVRQRYRRRAASRCSNPVFPVHDSGGGRMPREALDAPENLPKEAPRQAVVRHVSPLETGAPPGRGPDRTGRAARSKTWPDRALQQRTVATPRRCPKKFDILFERRESPSCVKGPRLRTQATIVPPGTCTEHTVRNALLQPTCDEVHTVSGMALAVIRISYCK